MIINAQQRGTIIMEVKKLNCTACGAPIAVPDDLDHINCAACGSFLAIQRGEGYIALKVAEKITRAIADSGRGTQEVIRQGNQDTQIELRRMQLQYELSTAELKLSNIQAEIRGTPAISGTERRLQQLRVLEYAALDRVRDVKTRILQLSEQTTQTLIPGLMDLVSLLQAMMQVSAATGQSSSQIKSVQQWLQQEMARLNQQITDLRIKALTSQLKFYKQTSWPTTNLAELSQVLKIIDEDLAALSRLPVVVERTLVQQSLESRRTEYYHQWTKLEDARIRGMLSSGSEAPINPTDMAALQTSLAVVQQDIHRLAPMVDNPVAQSHLKILRQQEDKLIHQIKDLNKQAAREAAKLAQAQQRAAAREAADSQARQRAAQRAAKQAARAAQDDTKAAAGGTSGPGWFTAIGMALAAFFAGIQRPTTPPSPETGETPLPMGAAAVFTETNSFQRDEAFMAQTGLTGAAPITPASSGNAPAVRRSLQTTPTPKKAWRMPVLLIALLTGTAVFLISAVVGLIVTTLVIPSEILKDPNHNGIIMLPFPVASILAGLAMLAITAPKAGFRFLGLNPPADGVYPVSLNTFRGLVIVLIIGVGIITSFSLGFLFNPDKGMGIVLVLLTWCMGPIISLVLAGLSVLVIKAPRALEAEAAMPVPERTAEEQPTAQAGAPLTTDQPAAADPFETNESQTVG